MPEMMMKVPRPEGKDISYQYAIDLNKLGVEAGDNITYFFQVGDNDAVNGSKTSKTGLLSYQNLRLKNSSRWKMKTRNKSKTT